MFCAVQNCFFLLFFKQNVVHKNVSFLHCPFFFSFLFFFWNILVLNQAIVSTNGFLQPDSLFHEVSCMCACTPMAYILHTLFVNCVLHNTDIHHASETNRLCSKQRQISVHCMLDSRNSCFCLSHTASCILFIEDLRATL